MAYRNRPTDRKFRRLSPVVALVTAAASLLALSGTASAGSTGVTSVSGSAFGEHVDVKPFGGTLVSGPIPTVTLPAGGGNVDDSLPSIIVPPSGPATGVFLTATGPLTAHSQGTLGATGGATSNASLAGVSSLGVFMSTSVASQCSSDASATTAGTTLTASSTLKVSRKKTVTLDTSPAPGKTYQGIDNSPGGSGDTFTVILNEQMVSSTGPGTTAITVNAVHVILHGPTATGDIVLAQSHCDSTVSTGPTVCTKVTGSVTGPVVVGPSQNICYVNAIVTGGITVKPGGQLSVTNSIVYDGIRSNGAVAFDLCGTDVRAPATGATLSVSGTTGPVRIGDPAAGCLGNSIAGNVSVASNSGGVVFGNNFVGGKATFTGNTGGPIVVKNNFIGAALGCTTNSPAPVNAGQPNTAASKTGQCTGV